MTKEEKDLLLKDLSSRLQYEVHCCVLNLNKTIKEDNDIIYGIVGNNIVTLKSNKNECYMYYQIKPYLRPMSSMTEEEREVYLSLQDTGCLYYYEFGDVVDDFLYFDNYGSLDYLNSIHVDYRGLIEKGLAIEASSDMYKIK